MNTTKLHPTFEPKKLTLFYAVTLFIWANRVWLAWTNPDDSVAERIVWSIPITFFVMASVILLIAHIRGANGSDPLIQKLGRWLVVVTVVFWVVRLPMISLADHEFGFKLIHAILALVSVGLALLGWRGLNEGNYDRTHHGPANSRH